MRETRGTKGGSGSHARRPAAGGGSSAGRRSLALRLHAGCPARPRHALDTAALGAEGLQAGPGQARRLTSPAGRRFGSMEGQQGPWIAPSADPELGEQLGRWAGALEAWVGSPDPTGGSARSTRGAAKAILGPWRCP